MVHSSWNHWKMWLANCNSFFKNQIFKKEFFLKKRETMKKEKKRRMGYIFMKWNVVLKITKTAKKYRVSNRFDLGHFLKGLQQTYGTSSQYFKMDDFRRRKRIFFFTLRRISTPFFIFCLTFSSETTCVEGDAFFFLSLFLSLSLFSIMVWLLCQFRFRILKKGKERKKKERKREKKENFGSYGRVGLCIASVGFISFLYMRNSCSERVWKNIQIFYHYRNSHISITFYRIL